MSIATRRILISFEFDEIHLQNEGLADLLARSVMTADGRVIIPTVTVGSWQTKDVEYAQEWDLTRHAEKQGCSRSDAYSYFEDQGYDMSRLDD